MNDTPPNGLSAIEVRDRIHEGLLSSTEVVTACLDGVSRTDDQLHAWACIDRKKALSEASEMDDIRMRGRPVGSLHGIPVGLKDIIDTTDYPTERGSPAFSSRQPEANAHVVDRLQEAGAVIMGKTVTTEFAFMHPAKTRNPHNPDHSPGGSSSGSAAAVAGFHVPLAIGTQTNGSVIRPASFCGVYGFKPSAGIISRSGFLQTSKTLDQVGVFARTLEDVALLVDAIADYDPADSASYLRPRPQMLDGAAAPVPVEPDFVWLELPFADRLETATLDGFEELISALGGRIERLPAPEWFGETVEVQRVIHEYEICLHLAGTFRDHWEHVSDTLKPIVERGQKIGQDEYEKALEARLQVQGWFDEFYKDYDAILTPAAAGEAPRFDAGHTGDPVFCTPWTVAGLPCISLPLLTGENGLPVGVQLVGGREEDDRLLRTANWMLRKLEI